ncbi:hypothetical protein CROQUDRAFT_225629 [Cronartium quercuum f. sp. fusiforme G11]|uniref:Uncharacterized protein n=1 Tax=Cronartium quercuum f. sp. fusiforme G11 TaxID=708437 RepID=A0A9P6T8F4_9BASI|nr:hypothetical protein CROQUDRAFT_225629 [Cronartium quercuum f. sp. fusiforme G11]
MNKNGCSSLSLFLSFSLTLSFPLWFSYTYRFIYKHISPYIYSHIYTQKQSEAVQRHDNVYYKVLKYISIYITKFLNLSLFTFGCSHDGDCVDVFVLSQDAYYFRSSLHVLL